MLTGIVLTHNEQDNLGACLQALAFCDEVIVVDDNSTDDTVKIAKKLGAKIYNHALNNDFSAQHNWILEQIKSTWVLFVDADEIVTPALATEIKTAIEKIEYKGYLIKRTDFMWGRRMKYGDVWGNKVLRLARRGAGIWQGQVHETWQIDGRVGTLSNFLEHRPHANLVEFLQHLNYYSTLKADEFFAKGRKTSTFEIVLAPIVRFNSLYILKLGFLDGTAGFIHAMCMAFYAFLVAGKLFLRYKGIPK